MSTSKNVTFNLPPELIEKYKFYVKQNFFPSVNVGVKEVLEMYSKKNRKRDPEARNVEDGKGSVIYGGPD